jgi:CDP-glucose 4,6-dehydratase
MFGDVYRGRTAWVSGHTGFKGSWLCEWLLSLGARVYGFALEPESEPSLFDRLGLSSRLHHEIADVRDAGAVSRSIASAQPDFVFHLAAQALVRRSYREPAATLASNVLGTAHVLEAMRPLRKRCGAVIVTSDKCYRNDGPHPGFHEDDPLGGRDPYSASKAAAEIVAHAYRCSFFDEHPVRIATARAGNVIGGGDWAADRLVPDCIRSLERGEAIAVRNPAATRPWQHVLEPLAGYLWLGASLFDPALRPAVNEIFPASFNFGPRIDGTRTVVELVLALLRSWPGQWKDVSDPASLHEAETLQLSTERARAVLGWECAWDFDETAARTARWYRDAASAAGHDAVRALVQRDIDAYAGAARRLDLRWAADGPASRLLKMHAATRKPARETTGAGARVVVGRRRRTAGGPA